MLIQDYIDKVESNYPRSVLFRRNEPILLGASKAMMENIFSFSGSSLLVREEGWGGYEIYRKYKMGRKHLEGAKKILSRIFSLYSASISRHADDVIIRGALSR